MSAVAKPADTKAIEPLKQTCKTFTRTAYQTT